MIKKLRPSGVSRVGILFLSLLWMLVLGCATTNRTKTLALMAGAGLAGMQVGVATAPSHERSEMHGAFWGSVSAAFAGALGLFIFDEQKRSDELVRQAQVMQTTLESLREDGSLKGPELLYTTMAPFGKDIPTEYQNLVRPGRWSVYRLNQWVSHGEGTLVHQDRMIRLVPPQLSPNSQSSAPESVAPLLPDPVSQ